MKSSRKNKTMNKYLNENKIKIKKKLENMETHCMVIMKTIYYKK